MRISVDIEKNLLKEVMALTGESGKSPALAKAVEEFVRRRKAAHFGRLIRESAFDYPEYGKKEENVLNPIPPLGLK